MYVTSLESLCVWPSADCDEKGGSVGACVGLFPAGEKRQKNENPQTPTQIPCGRMRFNTRYFDTRYSKGKHKLFHIPNQKK